MRVSRRTLLGTAGVAISAGLAGCIGGPSEYTQLGASVRDSFGSEPPVSVPVTVDVTVQNVESKDVALRGVELVCYDSDRELLASEPLGDFAWREAESERRESEEHGSTFGTTTTYSASWTLEPSIEVDAVPEWLSFRVGEVWFGDDDSQSAVVGTARASSPPPALTARVERFVSERPPPDSVGPDDYESSTVRSGTRVENPLLPYPTTARFWYGHREEQRADFVAAAEAFAEESAYRIDPSERENLRRDPVDAFRESGSESPHLVELPHNVAADFDARGLLSDQADALESRPRDAFVDPAAEAGTIEERTIGVPHSLETVALLYNRDLVAEPPETVSELTANMERHHDPDDGKYGLSYPLFHPYYYSAWARAFGGYYYDAASDSLGLTEPETVRGIEFVAEELFPYVSRSRTAADPIGAFVAGDAPFAIVGPGHVASAANDGIDVGVTTLPEHAGGSPSPSVFVDLLSFTSRLREPRGRDATPAATSFAEWYATNETRRVRTADERGTVPASADAIDSDDLPATTAGFAASAAMGTLEPPTSTMRIVYPNLQDAFEAVVAGERTAATALAEAEERIERVREREQRNGYRHRP